MDARMFSALKRIERLESDVKGLEERVSVDAVILTTLIESINIIEAATAASPRLTITLFYELIDKYSERAGPNQAVARRARIVADMLNAKEKIKRRRERSTRKVQQ